MLKISTHFFVFKLIVILYFVTSTDDDADVCCKQNLDLAVEIDPNNAEAFHTMASYWLCKEDKEVILL